MLTTEFFLEKQQLVQYLIVFVVVVGSLGFAYKIAPHTFQQNRMLSENQHRGRDGSKTKVSKELVINCFLLL
jgi:hypothetical protein